MKKFLAATGAVVLALGLALIAGAAPASAHTSTITATCDSLTVNLENYSSTTQNPTSNTVKVIIDGVSVTNPPTTHFGAAFSGTWTWDPTVKHSYQVIAVAYDNSVYNVYKSGVAGACATPEPVTFTEASCTNGTGSYTVPTVANVTYSLNGVPVTGTNQVAAGTSVTVIANAAPGFTLTGTTSWQHTYAPAPTDCEQFIAPLPPTVTPIVACGTHGSISTTPVEGVIYTFTTGSPTQTEGAYVIVATPASGFSFEGAQSVTFSGTLGDYTDCATTTVATPPSATAESCDATEDSATIVSGSIRTYAQKGIEYTIHRTDAAPAAGARPAADIVTSGGVTLVPAGTYTVTASTTDGSTLTGRTVWAGMIVGSVDDCVQLPTHALIDGSVVGSDQTCSAGRLHSGVLTFAQTPGAIVYHLNGSVVTADTLTVAPGTYVITATPATADFQVSEPDHWTVVINPAPTVCGDLPTLAVGGDSGTLAYTGVDGEWVGAVAVMGSLLIAGGVLMLRRRRRA